MPRPKKVQQRFQFEKRRQGFAPLEVITLLYICTLLQRFGPIGALYIYTRQRQSKSDSKGRAKNGVPWNNRIDQEPDSIRLLVIVVDFWASREHQTILETSRGLCHTMARPMVAKKGKVELEHFFTSLHTWAEIKLTATTSRSLTKCHGTIIAEE